jgi:hypothetical protein
MTRPLPDSNPAPFHSLYQQTRFGHPALLAKVSAQICKIIKIYMFAYSAQTLRATDIFSLNSTFSITFAAGNYAAGIVEEFSE